MARSRLDLYLQWSVGPYYVNSDRENQLVNKFASLYSMAKSSQDSDPHASPENLDKWRRAYEGTLNALEADGTESRRKSRSLRKMAYELIESKVDNTIPMPKILPRYRSDIPVVERTENYLKFEANRILTKYENDRSERATYVDGTGWYKVWWDSLDNTHERSGSPKIEFLTVDEVVPQPGVTDWRQLEYVFERRNVSLARIYDLTGRIINPVSKDVNMCEVITCYYLNEHRVVGRFAWSSASRQVIFNDKDWQIRKLRTCTQCGTVNPQGQYCRNCGGTRFSYKNATEEILSEDLMEIYNPYKEGEDDDPANRDTYAAKVFLTAGTKIPYYQIHQLPFVPRPAVSSMNSLYGMSDVALVLDMQDCINKVMSKAVDKTLKSGAVVTKPEKLKLSDKDETFKILGVRSPEEGQMVTCKQVIADTSADLILSNNLYDSGKASSGVTDSFQGAKDTTASSGKAKQFAAAQSAGRIESLRVMKAAAFAGVYELLLKYLLAFSDEPRQFTRVLPDGSEKEESWNKYMFLDKDKYGELYYRDDFHFDCDPASTLSQNRVSMWQETQDKFLQGAFGNPQDPRTLKLFWNIMSSFQYPLANVAIAGIKETEQHLDPALEQALMQNPQALQMAVSMIQQTQGGGQGGARPNSGPEGNGATHAANVERTNERNRAASREVIQSAQQGGGMNENL